jgi:integrase
MAKYSKRKDGLYETSRMIDGKRVYFRSKTIKGVDDKILAYRGQKQRGRKVGAIADAWFESKERELRPATVKAYKYALKFLLDSPMSERYATEIKPLDVKRFVNDCEAQGYSGETVATILHVIKAVFSFAVLAGDIDVSPATEVTRSRNLPKTTRSALTEEDERKVEAYRGDDYLLGLVLLYTGMRRGEAMALTWQDIDRGAGVIHVTKKVNYTTAPVSVDNFLKSANGRRDVPILAPLAAALPANRIGLVFGDEAGKHLTSYKFEQRWKRYCEAVGIKATPHQFRHSFATLCYEAGIDSMSAAAMMGDTPDVVAKVYTELRKAHHEQEAERVSAYLEMRAAERGVM